MLLVDNSIRLPVALEPQAKFVDEFIVRSAVAAGQQVPNTSPKDTHPPPRYCRPPDNSQPRRVGNRWWR